MLDLIIHIGYPKTATTTIQDSWFHQLNDKGIIKYFGKVNRQDLKEKNQYFLLYDEVIQGDKDIQDMLTLSENKLNVISHESLTIPKVRNQWEEPTKKVLNEQNEIDPFLFPRLIKGIFDEVADNIEILVTIRNQQDILNSFFAHYYNHITKNNQDISSWDDYLTRVINMESTVFDYNQLITEYQKSFQNDIKILLFEEFVEDKKAFINELSGFMGLEQNVFIENVGLDSHKNKKDKVGNNYLQEEIRTEWLHEILVNNILVDKIKMLDENNLIYTTLDRIHNLIFTRDISIDSPTPGQKEAIYDKFNRSNRLLGERFNLSMEKLEKYDYIRDDMISTGSNNQFVNKSQP